MKAKKVKHKNPPLTEIEWLILVLIALFTVPQWAVGWFMIGYWSAGVATSAF